MQDHAAIGRQHLRPNPAFRAGRRVGADKGDCLADRLFHQLGRSQQVIVEILFDNADAGSGQGDGFGADLRGDIGEVLFVPTGGQGHLAAVSCTRLCPFW